MGLDASILSSGVCKQHRGRPGCASAESDQRLIHFLERTICKLATDEISISYLVAVAEETVLKLALSETRKTGFDTMRPIWSNL